jgi:hypothetical protein
MTAAEQRIADLEQQLAELAAQVEHLEHEAILIRTVEEMVVRHAGYSIPQRAPLKSARPRHLHLIASGGAR